MNIKKIKYATITTASLMVLWLLFMYFADMRLMKQGEEIALRAEVFKKQYGRFPKDLNEIGLTESEEGPLFYNTIYDGEEYVVSYSCSSVGESASYYSSQKKWIKC